MTTTDWAAWHHRYDDPHSGLARRLRVVQRHIAAWLDETAPAAVTVVAACAGEGRDLLPVLAGRGDAHRVQATLLEYDSRNVERAKRSVEAAGLRGITVSRADAGLADAYAGSVPADLVLLCGVFGNIEDAAVHRLIGAVPQLCRPGSTVIWTRHRHEPDLTGQVRQWFAGVGCEEVEFTAPAGEFFSVGRHRFAGQSQELRRGTRLFEFVR